MLEIKKDIIIKNKQGLHARPAAVFVQIANKFDSDISVIKDKEEVNGKSIMGILMLAAEQGAVVCIPRHESPLRRQQRRMVRSLVHDVKKSPASRYNRTDGRHAGVLFGMDGQVSQVATCTPMKLPMP